MAESFAGITVPEGEPGELRSAAHAFAGMADALNATAADLKGMPGMLSSWRGPASTIYADSCITNGTAAQNAVWACQIVAQAVIGYAETLQEAKKEAREAIHDAKDATKRIKAAEDAISTAQARIAEATFSLNAAETEIMVTGATGAPAPDAIARRDSANATISDAAAAERAARRELEQARDDLDRAKRRGERAEEAAKDGAGSAAAAVSASGELAPAPIPVAPPPAPKEEEKDKPWWEDVGGAIADGAKWTGGQMVGVGKGFGEGVVGIGEGAYMLYRLSPTNALVNRDDFEESWGDMGKAAEFAWNNPGEFGKAVANWEDLKEGRYGEWLGNLGPDAVLAVATGGAGTAVSRGTRTMKAVKALQEGADGLAKARAAHRALTPASKFGDKTVGSAADDLSVSGWAKPKPEGYVNVPPERVRDLSNQIGHDLKPAKPSFLDGKRYPEGFDGKFNASHAEKQLGAVHPGTHVSVDLDMCSDCKSFFAKYAHHTGEPQLVTDPETTRLFLPNEQVIEIRQPSDWPLDPFNTKAAVSAGVGSEGLSTTQR